MQKLQGKIRFPGLDPASGDSLASAAIPPSVQRRARERRQHSKPWRIAKRWLDHDAEHRDRLLDRARVLAARDVYSEADVVLINNFIAAELGCFQYAAHNSNYMR